MKVSEAFVTEILTNTQFREEVQASFLEHGFTVELPEKDIFVPMPVLREACITHNYTKDDLISRCICCYVYGKTRHQDGSPGPVYTSEMATPRAVDPDGYVSWGSRELWFECCHPTFYGQPRWYRPFHGVINEKVECCSIADCLDGLFEFKPVDEEYPHLIGKNTDELTDLHIAFRVHI